MKRILIATCLLAFVSLGCNDPAGIAAKSNLDIATAINSVVTSANQLYTANAITATEDRNILTWSQTVNTLNGTYGSCISAASAASSKAAAFVACADTFLAAAENPTVLAELKVTNPNSQATITGIAVTIQAGLTTTVSSLQTLSAQGK
jgi:hypothetical protein